MEEIIIKRSDEERYLQNRIADNSIFINPLSFDDIIEAVRSGKLNLSISKEDGQKPIDDKCLKEINMCMPSLLKIIDKPRSFIKTLEEKVPVETAKKINAKAIMKLSRDSNDWHARTILNVKPKNVVSDVNEETLDIYENRFIYTLIGKISQKISEAKVFYSRKAEANAKKKYGAEMAKHYRYTTQSFGFYNTISKPVEFELEDKETPTKLEDILKMIHSIEKKIKIIRNSDFYNNLRKKKKVSDPIQKTNILMFDFHYNKAYKLWKLLNQTSQVMIEDADVDSDIDVDYAYNLYTLLNIMVVLKDMDFKEINGAKLTVNDNSFDLDEPMIFQRNSDIITLAVNDKTFIFSICTPISEVEFRPRVAKKNGIVVNVEKKYGKEKRLIEKLRVIDQFTITSDYFDFDSKLKSEIDDKTEAILNGLVVDKNKKKDKNNQVSSQYCLVAANLDVIASRNPLTDKLYKRFVNIGDNFSDLEKTENLKKWSSYKTGIQIISPFDLRTNFLRLERIFNYKIISHKDFQKFGNECPLCGSKNIHSRNNGNDYECDNCQRIISFTYCLGCDSKKENPLIFVKYKDEKFLESEDITSGEDKPFNIRMVKYELLMGEFATTAFQIAYENNAWKLKTLCPRCGVKLGDKKQ